LLDTYLLIPCRDFECIMRGWLHVELGEVVLDTCFLSLYFEYIGVSYVWVTSISYVYSNAKMQAQKHQADFLHNPAKQSIPCHHAA
jgi:hypothetical protein